VNTELPVIAHENVPDGDGVLASAGAATNEVSATTTTTSMQRRKVMPGS
jgi:hypothetical protein